jgi:hypothetical protein
MTKKNITRESVERALLRFEDPQINSAVFLASTPTVAKLIIETLPGVRRLLKGDSQVANLVLSWLDTETTVADQRRAAIGLYILEHFPSEAVKDTLAKYISVRRFTGINSRLAADTFLKAAGIEVPFGADPVMIALREARKLRPRSPKEGSSSEGSKQVATAERKESRALKE